MSTNPPHHASGAQTTEQDTTTGSVNELTSTGSLDLARRTTVFDASNIKRPDPALQTYYLLVSLCSLVLFPIVFVPLWIRYQTMQYQFDDEGVSMSWGFFFRKEVYLTYGRLQDIHVTRNIIERWMGLAKVPIQTASGSHGATMTIEGIRNPEPLRDFLYSKMRGAKSNEELHEATVIDSDDATDPITELLTEIRDQLREKNQRGES